MRVVEVSQYGGPEVLRLSTWPDPKPAQAKVRVRVLATTVGPADLSTRQGAWASITPHAQPPIVLGWDFVGELMDAAADLPVGQRVAGMYPWLNLADGSGTYAEMVLADPAWFTALPDGMDPVEASTLPSNGQAASQGLRAADLRSGESLLVTGAGGTVGGFVVQLAAAAGIHVVAVTAADDEPYVRSLGITDIIVRTTGKDLVSLVRHSHPDGVDAVLDASASLPDLIQVVRDGGAFISVSDPATPTAERGIRVDVMHIQPDAAELCDLVSAMSTGALRTRIADVLPLADAATAHRRVAAGPLHGKLVLTP